MTKRRELINHLSQLKDIRDIMSSMKILAYMETRKLSGFLPNQRQLVRGIDEIARDFLSFYPYSLQRHHQADTIVVLFGSERGFCGTFNQYIVEALNQQLPYIQSRNIWLIPIGYKLNSILHNHPNVYKGLSGADVTEELDSVLSSLLDCIKSLQANKPPADIVVLHNVWDSKQVAHSQIMPPFLHHIDSRSRFYNEPMLYLSPEKFLSDLSDFYLFSILYEIAYDSLMAENHQRVEHMNGAISHLDEKVGELSKRCNRIRQEEITEEIEVILLNAESESDSEKNPFQGE